MILSNLKTNLEGKLSEIEEKTWLRSEIFSNKIFHAFSIEYFTKTTVSRTFVKRTKKKINIGNLYLICYKKLSSCAFDCYLYSRTHRKIERRHLIYKLFPNCPFPKDFQHQRQLSIYPIYPIFC